MSVISFNSNAAKTAAIISSLVDNADAVLDLLVAHGALECFALEDRLVFGFPEPCKHYRFYWENADRICSDCKQVLVP